MPDKKEPALSPSKGERLVSGAVGSEDAQLDTSLRPKSFADFVGQDKIKESLRISITAAKGRGETLDHLMLYGPPGLGKTTMAYIIASEMGVNIKVTSGPAVERPGDLAAILTNLRQDDILFIDEIHRLGKTVEEVLYPAMEEFALDIVIGKGAGARSLRLSLPRFTLIGATTRFALLSPPLRDRFGAVYRLDYYPKEAIGSILKRSARIMKVKADPEGLDEIARRARGTPRVANRLLKSVRDYAQVKASGVITHAVAMKAISWLEVDALGLDEVDHKVLNTIIGKFDGGPVGLDTLAASVGEDPDTIMEVYEPYLLQLGFLDRTPRGRLATRLAFEHLGLKRKKGGPQAELFQ
ncbi:MAG: ruvB [Dehalococcoidia bacterium]|nr:ruvB [Dehalococcoidia bacterium]